MKRLMLFFGLIIVLGFNARAQVYAKFYAGYSMPLAGATFVDPSSSLYSVMVYPIYEYGRVESNATYTQHPFSLGQGIDIKGAIGLNFTDNLGAEVDFGFLMGSKIEATQTSKVTIVGVLINSEEKYTYQANMMQLAPMLVLNTDMDVLNLFMKFGPVINTGVLNGSYFSNLNGQTTQRDVKFTGGFSVGMSSVLGASIQIMDNISLFGELQVMTLAYSPAKARVVKYEVNGNDNLANLKVEDKEYVFSRTYQEDMSTNHPDDQPTELLKIHFPMSNIGIHLGVQMSF